MPVSIEDREERVIAIDTRLAEIDADYAGERMPTEIRDEWNSLNAEREEQIGTIAELRARRDRLAAVAATAASGNGGTSERVQDAAPVMIRRRGEEIYNLARIRAESSSDDDYRARLHDNARRAIEQAQYGSVRTIMTREQAQTNVLRLLDDIDQDGTLAKRILATGSPEYERWFWAQIAGRSDVPRPQAALTLSGTGVAVPFTLDPTIILTSDGATNPLRAMSRVETITGKTWEGVTSAGITVGRIGEAQPSTDQAPSLAQPSVTPTTVRGFVPFSIESDQDWTQLRSEMTRLLMDAKDVEEATSFVTGSGSAPAAGGIQATLSTTANVNDGSGGFTAAAIFSMENNLPPRYMPRAQWLARKNFYNLVRALDTNGTLYARLTDGRPPELIGYTAREASAMPVRFTSSTVFGARYAILGDFSQFLIVDKAGMDVEIVPHLFSNNLPTAQRGIFALWRNNSKVLNDNAFRILVYAT